MKTYKKAVVVMRAQPPHKSHLWLIREALKLGERVVVVLGSCFQARTPKNPFTGPERQTMIELALSTDDRARVDFVLVRDYYNNAYWADAVKKAVQTQDCHGRQIAIVGHEKDGSTYYLRLFQSWALEALPRHTLMDATTIREALYGAKRPAIALAAVADLIDEPVADFLAAHLVRPEWDRLRAEREHYLAEEAMWGASPKNYGRFVLCADALVQWEDQVILVRRGPGVGEGLLAMPGGHVESADTTLPTAIRELREEVGIGLLDDEFERALVGHAFLEAPTRSQRPGRVISMAYHFRIKSAKRPVIGQVSAEAEPAWFAVAALPALEETFFEDHFMGVDHFLTIT